MSDRTEEREEIRSDERSEEELRDLDVAAEEAEDVKGGQEMPPQPRYRS